MFRNKIVRILVAALLFFLGYVSSKDGKFHYERSGVINAPAEKIFPYLSSFKLGHEWSPYEKMDPNMQRNFVGPDGQVGSVMEFAGNREAGSGKLEILKMTPNELVEIKLNMTKPFAAENLIQYKLAPEGAGTRFTWSMSGDGGFLNKFVGLFIDCEKLIGDQETAGIANLKSIVETAK